MASHWSCNHRLRNPTALHTYEPIKLQLEVAHKLLHPSGSPKKIMNTFLSFTASFSKHFWHTNATTDSFLFKFINLFLHLSGICSQRFKAHQQSPIPHITPYLKLSKCKLYRVYNLIQPQKWCSLEDLFI